LKLVNKIIYSNIFLSVAAVLLTLSAQIQLGMKPQWHAYFILIFFATLFEYNRHRLIAEIKKGQTLKWDKHNWIRENLKKTWLLIIISITGFIIAVFTTKTAVLFAFVPLGILTILYSVPGLENKNYLFKLREIPYLKIFLIAFVWSASTILLPVIQEGQNILNTQVILLFTERFFFIFAITIPFDIRDMKADRESGLKTIPLLVNQKKALILSYLSLIICLFISFFHYRLQNNWFVVEALSISLITTYLFIKLKFFRNLGRYYYQVLDATLLLQGALVLVFYFFTHN
jgi:4-hydroxybenzoate polyprenyltransferase